MTRYLVDTSVLIDVTKLGGPSREKLLSLVEAGHEVLTCAIVVAEYYSGVARGMAPQWDRFLDSLPYQGITRRAAEKAGAWRRDFARQGRTLSVADTLVAAVAWDRDAALLTENLKDFPMPGVRVMSLAEG